MTTSGFSRDSSGRDDGASSSGAGRSPVSPRPAIPVSELVASLKEIVEDEIGRVLVAGEISNLRPAASGHLYFTLKDDLAQIRGVMFRGDAQRLRFALEDGLEVIVGAECSVYAARGELQLVVRTAEPRGRGALQLAFEQLRARLEREGLFDPARKRPLPAFPRAVGIVTSASAAALRDVIEVSGRRFPSIPLVIAPTRVQGEGAEHEIAAALERLGRRAERLAIDVVLLVRGGGSLEDLQCFNSEVVARAIVAMPIPVVSGVGHETDLSIADLAADWRAPTPSAAAETVIPDRIALGARLSSSRRALARAMTRVVERRRTRLAHSVHALVQRSPRARLAARRARLDAMRAALLHAMQMRLAQAQGALATAAGRLESLSPLAVLSRGYAIARREPGGEVVRRATECAAGDRLRLRLAEGELRAQVIEPLPGPAR